MTKKEYWFWLCNIPGMTRKKIKRLLNNYEKSENVFCLSTDNLLLNTQLTDEDKNNIIKSRSISKIQENYGIIQNRGIKFISLDEDEYPRRLKNIEDKPYGLYIKGVLPKEEIPSVAIIGARNCSNYGKKIAEEYAKTFAKYGVQVISGLARGIDSAGHRGALTGMGSTYAVLGCGVDVCYPRENLDLYTEIIKKGGIISEYPLHQHPLPRFFPERNRLISGLSDLILVMEAREKSGSFITVDFALEQGKDIYALPGRVSDSLSVGCNRLIKQSAGIADSPESILMELGITTSKNKKINKNYNNLLESIPNMVYSCLDLQPKSLDEIIHNVQLTISEVLSAIVELELQGFIEETSKNHYAKTDRECPKNN